MDMFQDIVICSKFKFAIDYDEKKGVELEQTEHTRKLNNDLSFDHLRFTHRRIIDSIHPLQVGSTVSFFKIVLEDRANALLTSEDTINFYHYNLQIVPVSTKFVVSYLMRILNILLKYNQPIYKEMSKLVRKTALKLVPNKDELLQDLSCEQIVAEFENSCLRISEEEQKALDLQEEQNAN